MYEELCDRPSRVSQWALETEEGAAPAWYAVFQNGPRVQVQLRRSSSGVLTVEVALVLGYTTPPLYEHFLSFKTDSRCYTAGAEFSGSGVATITIFVAKGVCSFA